VQLFGEADVRSCWSPAHLVEVPQLPELQDAPDVRVIHTRLVIGQSDEGRVRGPLVNQVQQNLVVVDRQTVHVLGPEVGVGAHHAHDE